MTARECATRAERKHPLGRLQRSVTGQGGEWMARNGHGRHGAARQKALRAGSSRLQLDGHASRVPILARLRSKAAALARASLEPGIRHELRPFGMGNPGFDHPAAGDFVPDGMKSVGRAFSPLVAKNKRPGDRPGRGRPFGVGGADALFLLRWLKSPLGIGAVAPSSRFLARAMARQVARRRPGPVVELGGGTGSITRALLDAGVPASDLIVVERDPELAAVLERRFPGIRLVRGDATRLGPLLEAMGVTRVAAVVSGLPLLSMPTEVQRQIVENSFGLLGREGVLVQFTYGLTSPIPHAAFGLRGWRADRIWRNVPPAAIWRFRLARAAAR